MPAIRPTSEKRAPRAFPCSARGGFFRSTEESILEAPITHVPAYWKKLWGIDFGIGHPFAAVLALYDADNDVVHIHHTIRMADAISLAHVHAMRSVAGLVPVAWPHDGAIRDVHSGEVMATTYRKLGLAMVHEHATWPEGGMSTEAGLHDWDEREKTGRLKCANHLSDWLEERRMYHRKDGHIVKLKDDLMSATRMVLMMKRYARPVMLGAADRRVALASRSRIAQGIDFDLFTGA